MVRLSGILTEASSFKKYLFSDAIMNAERHDKRIKPIGQHPDLNKQRSCIFYLESFLKFHTLNDLEAAHDINEGMDYLKRNSLSTFNYSFMGILDTISAGLSTGATLANFPATQVQRNVEKIRIKNNSLCILCPEYTRASANADGNANFSRTPGVLFPGDEGEFEFSYRPTAYGINNGNGIFHLSMMVISADANFIKDKGFPANDEIAMLRINFYSNRFNKLFIMDSTLNDRRLEPAYASGINARGEDNVMTYFTYRGTQGSKEPSFGMSYFDVNAATVNERNATGATSLVFTPSAKRSAAPVTALNNPESENAIRNFLRASLHKFRGEDDLQPRSIAAVSTMISMLSSARDIYSSISTRTDSRTYLTVNLKNLTGKNMFILRRKHSNSMRMDNGIIMDGETGVLPLAFSSFRPAQPEIFLRIPTETGQSLDLVLVFTDYGDNRSVKISRVYLSGSGRTQSDPATNSSSLGATNFIFTFVDNSRNYRIFIEPTIVTSHNSPTIDVALLMVENRFEFAQECPGSLPPDIIHPDQPAPLPGI